MASADRAGLCHTARLRKVARGIRIVLGYIATAVLIASMCSVAYHGGWLAVSVQLVAWGVMALLTATDDHRSALDRRLGWHDGYKRGWRDNVDKKEYEPWPT